MSASIGSRKPAPVGARIVVESERVGRPARCGLIEAVVHPAPPAYRVLWDDGRTSIVTPASGCARIHDRAALDAQALARAINERIRELEQPWGGMYTFVCECADAACTQAISLSEQEYDETRAADGRYAAAPGHERRSERVVGRSERFVTVERWLA
jgi:hypothetical protein